MHVLPLQAHDAACHQPQQGHAAAPEQQLPAALVTPAPLWLEPPDPNGEAISDAEHQDAKIT